MTDSTFGEALFQGSPGGTFGAQTGYQYTEGRQEGRRSESIAQLGEAVRLRPDSAEAQNALGQAFNAFGEFKAGRGPFKKAIAPNPNFAEPQGVAELREGLRLDPDNLAVKHAFKEALAHPPRRTTQ